MLLVSNSKELPRVLQLFLDQLPIIHPLNFPRATTSRADPVLALEAFNSLLRRPLLPNHCSSRIFTTTPQNPQLGRNVRPVVVAGDAAMPGVVERRARAAKEVVVEAVVEAVVEVVVEAVVVGAVDEAVDAGRDLSPQRLRTGRATATTRIFVT